jgi:hypothetical protein
LEPHRSVDLQETARDPRGRWEPQGDYRGSRGPQEPQEFREPTAAAAAEPGDWRERRILITLDAHAIPLTLRQLNAKTGVPLATLDAITTKLCGSGAIKRLNTVIETFST